MTIRHFRGEYSFLSNFYGSPMIWHGKSYPTAEHLFQARKAMNEKDHEVVRTAPTPAEAKTRGRRKITCRSDWNTVRVQIMRETLEAKFSQNKDLLGRLLEIGDRNLIEENTWNDKFWGVCDGQGKNMLGRLLMDLRSKFKGDNG